MKKPSSPKQNDTVNRAELARLMGVSLPTIDDWQRRGCPVVQTGDRGRSYGFNVQAVIEWRVQDERRRQGLAVVAPVGDFGKPIYNPFRALAHDAAVSYGQFLYREPMVEDMIKAVREKTGCDDKAAKTTVATIFHLQWIVLSIWVEQDRFSKELAARGDMDFDAQMLKINPRAQFIPGPIPHEKIDNGDYTPEAMHDLIVELLGKPPIADEDAGTTKRAKR